MNNVTCVQTGNTDFKLHLQLDIKHNCLLNAAIYL